MRHTVQYAAACGTVPLCVGTAKYVVLVFSSIVRTLYIAFFGTTGQNSSECS